MQVRTKVIREGRALYLLEDVALPEGQPLIVTIEIPSASDDGDHGRETLDDVLGFDMEAQDKCRRQALLEVAGMFKAADYPPDSKPSAAVHHDEYIYRVDW